MLQLTPQSQILLATAPIDFRKGIDGLAAVCRQGLREQPLRGAIKPLSGDCLLQLAGE
jgi:transposase